MVMVSEAFLSLYTSAQPALQQFVAAHIPDLHEAEDVLQEVGLCLWRKFHEHAPGTSFQKWAIRVAQYEVLHARRSHARRRIVLTLKLSDRAAERYEQQTFVTAEARRRALEECLGNLAEPHRRLLADRYARARSFAELACETGGTEEQLRIKVFRIRVALRRCISAVLGPEESSPREVLG